MENDGIDLHTGESRICSLTDKGQSPSTSATRLCQSTYAPPSAAASACSRTRPSKEK